MSQFRDFSYCHTLTGTELHRVNQFNRIDNLFWKSTPSNVAHLAQNKFETILRTEADQGAGKKGATLQYFKGYSVKTCSFTPDSVVVRAESIIADSSHQAIELECRYLIGADGANSTVRNSLGIAMQGEEALQHLVNVHFSCPGLRKLLQPRPAMLYFTFNEVILSEFDISLYFI
jgi:2-polyprenyl-6-methoxyphenol hydroxylase-like FAD-dependent oxidoreductase